MPRGIPKSGYRMRRNKDGEMVKVYVGGAKAAPELPETHPEDIDTGETDEQIDKRLRQRFEVLELMSRAACAGEARAVIVSGPAGLGKSFTVEEVLRDYDPLEHRSTILKGFMRATAVYKTLHAYRHKGNVVVFDDADSVFFDSDALNLLKAACDTTERRRITWGAETRMQDDAGATLPTTFDFEGTIIFITNYDFDAAIAKGHRLGEHFNAMISRSHYIDTGMKTKRDYLIRIKQVVEQGLLTDRGLTPAQQKQVVDFVNDNKDTLRELTLRAVIKVAGLMVASPDKWEQIANVTMMKRAA